MLHRIQVCDLVLTPTVRGNYVGKDNKRLFVGRCLGGLWRAEHEHEHAHGPAPEAEAKAAYDAAEAEARAAHGAAVARS